MGFHYEILGNEWLTETLLRYLDWGIVWKDTELPLDEIEWERRAQKDSPHGELKWSMVRKVPLDLEADLLAIANECNRDDLEIYLTVKKKLKGRQAKIKHWIEVSHLSYGEIAKRLGISVGNVKKIYRRIK